MSLKLFSLLIKQLEHGPANEVGRNISFHEHTFLIADTNLVKLTCLRIQAEPKATLENSYYLFQSLVTLLLSILKRCPSEFNRRESGKSYTQMHPRESSGMFNPGIIAIRSIT